MGMTKEDAVKHLENMKWLLGVNNTTVDDIPLTKVIDDIAALLKAQEARVFNVGDFFGEEFGYLEYRTDRPGFSNFEPSPVLIGNIDEENVTVIFRSASVQKLPLDRINKNWRVWSNYPTHELLRAVKWE